MDGQMLKVLDVRATGSATTMGTTLVVSECHPVPAVLPSLKHEHVTCWSCVRPAVGLQPVPDAVSIHLLNMSLLLGAYCRAGRYLCS